MQSITKITAIIGILGFALLLAFTPPTNKKRIVIDAGHGGHDTGQIVDNLTESAINLTIAKKIQAQAEKQGMEVILLREDNSFVSLTDRAGMINDLNPDFFISIHVDNATNKNQELGNQMFIHDKVSTKEASAQLAGKLAAAFLENLDIKHSKISLQNFTLLRLVKVPGIHMSLGNMINDKERDYLTSDAGQQAVAASIVEALLD